LEKSESKNHKFWVFGKIRFKELPVLGVSETSKNHRVSRKNQQRPSSLRWIFGSHNCFLKNHG
jgi:hypothetical protein